MAIAARPSQNTRFNVCEKQKGFQGTAPVSWTPLSREHSGQPSSTAKGGGCADIAEAEKVFCTTSHGFAEAALTADTHPVICDAKEQHYLDSRGLQPASCKLRPKLNKQVVKADCIKVLHFGSAFIFVLIAPSHFHCGHGLYDFPLYLKIGHYFTVHNCFATFKSRWFIQRMDRKNRWQQKYSRTLSTATLAISLVLGQAGGGELLPGDENRASCDSSERGLLSSTSALCSVCLGTWTPSSVVCPLEICIIQNETTLSAA